MYDVMTTNEFSGNDQIIFTGSKKECEKFLNKIEDGYICQSDLEKTGINGMDLNY
jgi:hypothetical protein